MTDALVYNTFASKLATLNGKQCGVTIFGPTYTPVASDLLVDDLTGEAAVTRQTFDAEWDATNKVAEIAEVDQWPTFPDSDGVSGRWAVVYLDETGDADDGKVIAAIRYTDFTAADDWMFQPLNGFARNGDGTTFEARLAALEALPEVPDPADGVTGQALVVNATNDGYRLQTLVGTAPDPTDGTAGQALKTNGTAYYFGDDEGAPAPIEAVATSPTPGAIVVTVPAIDGTTYIVPDFAEASDFAFGASIPADVAGSFRLVVRPQTGAGNPNAYFVSDGGAPLTLISVGAYAAFSDEVNRNILPSDLTEGAAFDFTSDGTNGWQVECSKPTSDSFGFVTAVSNLRTHMYVGSGHDGGGVTDYIDQTRTGDDPGYYMAADNAELLVNGSSFPTPDAAMIALRNQASAAGEGVTGFYHARRMPVGLTFTITTPLGSITVTPANYASPQPVAGDVCLVNGLTIDGQWQHSNIKQSEDVRVGDDITWSTIGEGMFTDFEDISPNTVVAQTITNGVTTSAPSQDAVYDALALKAPLTTAVAALTPTTGTVDLDLATVNGEYRTHALSGNVTYTSSNRATGKSVTVKVLCDATPRTFTFPSWVFVGTAPTGIAANKTGILTVTWFGTADTDAVAAWSVQA